MKRSFLIAAVLFSGAALSRADLVNTSTRGMAGAGPNALISGFIIDSPAEELRWFLVRGVGPSLSGFGVGGALADPQIRLYDGRGTVVAANNDFGSAPHADLIAAVSADVGAFALSDNRESVLLVGLPAGAYTAVVSAPSGSSGTVLIETYEYEPVATGQASQTLSGLAASNPNLTVLATALRLTGLDVTLAEGGPFTVFAPTDAAFAALPAGTLDALIANPTQLAAVLQYHVVNGAVLSSALTNGQRVNTLLTTGAPLTVAIDGSGVKINTANVVAADVAALNGVVHVIDAVLVP